MLLPLNMAMLKFFTSGKEATREDVQEALRADYGKLKAFSDKSMDEALQTAFSNGLIAESRMELVDGRLKVYYQADGDMINTINSYVK